MGGKQSSILVGLSRRDEVGYVQKVYVVPYSITQFHGRHLWGATLF